MPCNYKNYPPNWFTEIRPRILERAKNCCEQCGVPNYEIILRGELNGIKVFQTDNGKIFDAVNFIETNAPPYIGSSPPFSYSNSSHSS